MVLPNRVKTDYTYDDLNRLTPLPHTKDNGNGDLLASYQYQLAKTGRRTGVTIKARMLLRRLMSLAT